MQIEGDSLDHQENVCREFAEKNGLRVIKVFADKGVSGQNSGRKEFNLLKETVVRGDTIVSYSISRLSRSLNDLLDLISECESKGVILKSLKEEIATDSPVSMFMTTLMASVAELEANMTRERVSDISRRKRQRGETYSRKPYGYDAVMVEKGKPKRLVPNLEEQMNINRMFELRMNWMGKIKDVVKIGSLDTFLDNIDDTNSSVRRVGFSSLSKLLAEEGILSRQGKPFSTSSLFHILGREYAIRQEKHENHILDESMIKEYIEYKMPLIVPYKERLNYLSAGTDGVIYNGSYVDENVKHKDISYIALKPGHKTDAKKLQKESEDKEHKPGVTNSRISKRDLEDEAGIRRVDAMMTKALVYQKDLFRETERRKRVEIMQDENTIMRIIIRTFDSEKIKVEKSQKSILPSFEEKVLPEKPEPSNKELKKLEIKYKIHIKTMKKNNPEYDEDEDPDALAMKLTMLELEE